MKFHQRLGQTQTKPQATQSLSITLERTVWLKQYLLLTLFYPNTGILDFHHQIITLYPGFQGYLTSRMRKLDRIVHQVEHNLLETLFIGHDNR
ncbi:hypothetical protein ES703_105543 [subsurface metagenome]